MKNYLDPHNMDPSHMGRPYSAMPEPNHIQPAPPIPPSPFQPPTNWCGEIPFGAPFDEYGMTHTFEKALDSQWIDNTFKDIINDNMSIPHIAHCGCGGSTELIIHIDIHTNKSYYYKCQDCDTRTTSFSTKANARRAWNRAMGAKYE